MVAAASARSMSALSALMRPAASNWSTLTVKSRSLVTAFRTDATAEPGDPLVFILFDSTAPQRQDVAEVVPE